MLQPRLVRCLAAAGLLFLAVPGCGSRPERLPAVRGRVFYHRLPLPGGTVVFTPDPDRGGSGPLAHADIETDGSYVLKTEDRAGAAPGWYRVTVVSLQPEPPGQPSSGPPHSLLPPRYRDPELSGLSFQVQDGQENTCDFNLE
jgi:hypothetical protein